MTTLATIALAAATTIVSAQPRQATRQDLEDLAAFQLPKSIGEFTVDFDIEGICKKGDKVVIRQEQSWVQNRSAILRQVSYEINGKLVGSAAGLIGWDGKQIKSTSYGILGSVSQGTWRKRGKNWVLRTRDIGPDGKEGSAVVMVKKVDEDTRLVTITDRVRGDEELPDITITYKRQ